jgi:hypothetical protein
VRAGAILAFVLLASQAHAWKPNTHVYLAEEARLDAINSGSVGIWRVNHYNRSISGVVGNYAVDPVILAALNQYPNHFRAGVLGPDAYPDIVTGQSAIHPDANHAGGADRWLRLLWRAKQNNDLRQVAFVTGFLAHAAGDMYGHTLVNGYSGAPWNFDDPNNPVKHILVEGYVGTKTPTVSTDISIDGLQEFIYANLINAPAGSEQDGLLAETADMTVPGIFNNLRIRLEADINDYYADVASLRAKIDSVSAPLDIPWRVALGVLQATRGLWTAYQEAWIQDIDAGLRAWPATSHKIAIELLLPPTGFPDTMKANEIMTDFWFDHMLSMLGAPDLAGEILGAINDVLTMILEPWRLLKERILDYLVEGATGRTVMEWKQFISNPALYLDARVGLGTQAALDLQMKLTSPSSKFDPNTFPAAYNTVTMIKLIFLSADARRQLMRDLGYGGNWPMYADDGEQNAMLGFIKSLDGDNEWRRNPRAMLAARDCHLYTQLFMNQVGEPTTQAPYQYKYGPYDNTVSLGCSTITGFTLGSGAPACGATLTGEVTLSGPAETWGSVFDVAHDSLVASTLPEHLWIAPNLTSRTFTVPVPLQNLASYVPDVTVSRMGASFNASRTVRRANMVSAVVRPQWKRIPVGAPLTGQFNFDCAAPPGTITVSSPGIAGSWSVVSIPGGAINHPFTVTAGNTPGDFTLSATFGGVTRTDTFTLISQQVSNLSFSVTQLSIGTQTTGTITLRQPAPAGGLQVTITRAAPLTGPTSLTVPAGQSSATFVLTANGPIPSQPGPVTVTARAVQDDPSVAKAVTLQFGVPQLPR